MNFTSMTFGAGLDNGTVGATGEIAFLPNETSQNTVAGYYLYHDETGVYFSTETYFDKMEVTDGCTMEGIDYPCEVAFAVKKPAVSFVSIYNNTEKAALRRQLQCSSFFVLLCAPFFVQTEHHASDRQRCDHKYDYRAKASQQRRYRRFGSGFLCQGVVFLDLCFINDAGIDPADIFLCGCCRTGGAKGQQQETDEQTDGK